MKIWALSLFFFFIAFNFTNAAKLYIDPQFPKPGQNFTATVDFSDEDYDGDITWFIDDKAIGDKSKSIQIHAKKLGKETKIKALISSEAKAPQVLSKTIRPVLLDVLYEADTFSPLFFKLAPLNSAGSSIKLHSIVQIPGKDSSKLLYVWKLNDKKLANASGIAKKDAYIKLSPFARLANLSLEIRNPKDNRLLAKRYIPIYIAKNSLDFYVKGLDSTWIFAHSLKDALYLNNKEELLALPFNFSMKSLFDPVLRWTWSVNGYTIKSEEANSPYVEVNFTDENSNEATVRLETRHKDIFLQHADYELKLERGESKNKIIHEILPGKDESSGFGI